MFNARGIETGTTACPGYSGWATSLAVRWFFEDGTRIEEKYKWHQIEGRTYHWNEPHEGTKYAIILYKSSGTQSKSSHMLNKRWPKNTVENISLYNIQT